MEQETESQPAAGSLLKWISGIGVALTLYVLSSGPAVYLRERGVISKQAVRVIYAPLIPLESWEGFGKYLGWWLQKGRS